MENTNSPAAPSIKVGDRIRWYEPISSSRYSFDTDPRNGEGIVEAVYFYNDGRLKGLTVAYNPKHNPSFTARAYYTAGFTSFEVIN